VTLFEIFLKVNFDHEHLCLKTIPEITKKKLLAFTLNGFLITPKTYNTLELFYHYVPLLSFLLRQKIRYTNFFPSSV